MPAYDYRCQVCRALTEVVHAQIRRPRIKCPRCGGATMRVISSFPHVKFDYKAWYTAEEGTRKLLHASRAGAHSPASEIAGKRT